MKVFTPFVRSEADPVFSSLEVVEEVATLIYLAMLNSRSIIVLRLTKVAR